MVLIARKSRKRTGKSPSRSTSRRKPRRQSVGRKSSPKRPRSQKRRKSPKRASPQRRRKSPKRASLSHKYRHVSPFRRSMLDRFGRNGGFMASAAPSASYAPPAQGGYAYSGAGGPCDGESTLCEKGFDCMNGVCVDSSKVSSEYTAEAMQGFNEDMSDPQVQEALKKPDIAQAANKILVATAGGSADPNQINTMINGISGASDADKAALKKLYVKQESILKRHPYMVGIGGLLFSTILVTGTLMAFGYSPSSYLSEIANQISTKGTDLIKSAWQYVKGTSAFSTLKDYIYKPVRDTIMPAIGEYAKSLYGSASDAAAGAAGYATSAAKRLGDALSGLWKQPPPTPYSSPGAPFPFPLPEFPLAQLSQAPVFQNVTRNATGV